MSRTTIMRRHRYRLTGGAIGAVATALTTATELVCDNDALLEQIADHVNPHARGDAGFGQLVGDDPDACLPRAAVVALFADTPAAGLDVFVLDNGHDDRHINAALWLHADAPPNTFPVYPYASLTGCTGVSRRTTAAAAATAKTQALAGYVLGGTAYPDTYGAPHTRDIARAVAVDTLAGPDIDDPVWEAGLPAPGDDIHADMLWNSGGLHAVYLLGEK